jgi:acetylornithine deacetylase/succinyl-diaminopimelate desuccinylase-like protein
MNPLISLLFAPSLALAAPPPPDWGALGRESASLLSAYLATDTTNPPGNERRGADLLAAYLAADGITAEIIEGEPGRANLIARIESGNPGPALCLLSHIDVVPAEAASWPVGKGPLSGAIDSEGFVWGRGALDMKGMGALEVMTLRLLQRQQMPLRRDVVLIAVADEEVDNAGIRLLADHHWDKLGCGWVVNEGGIGVRDLFMEGQTVYPISVGEKGVVWMRITATGEPGHGSTPVPDRAPERLLTAASRLQAHESEVRFHPAVVDLLGAVGAQQGGLLGAILQKPGLATRAVRGRFMANPVTKAVVTDTLNITGFGGANEPNVVPGEVWMQVDSRILPGQTPEALMAEVKALLPEAWYRVDLISSHPAAVSPYADDPFYAALVRHAGQGRADVAVGPVISPGYTDSVYLRSKGVAAYGLVPFEVSAEELGTMHGNNERVSVANLERGLRVLYGAVVDFAGDPSAPPRLPKPRLDPWGMPIGPGSPEMPMAPAPTNPWGPAPAPAPVSPWGP